MLMLMLWQRTTCSRINLVSEFLHTCTALYVSRTRRAPGFSLEPQPRGVSSAPMLEPTSTGTADVLTPAACRGMQGVPAREWSGEFGDDPRFFRACTSALLGAVPPDRWAKLHLDGMAQQGKGVHSVANLFSLLRNKRVALVGDSVTEQFFTALRCVTHASLEAFTDHSATPLPSPTVQMRISIPLPELHHACKRLWRATQAGQSLQNCTCKATDLDSWQRSQCASFASPCLLRAHRSPSAWISLSVACSVDFAQAMSCISGPCRHLVSSRARSLRLCLGFSCQPSIPPFSIGLATND